MSINTTKPFTAVEIDGVGLPLNDGKDMLQARVDAVTNCDYLFYKYSGAELPDISRLDTSKATSMKYMFGGCGNLTALDLSGFDTSNITNVYGIFCNCLEVETINLSNFDTFYVRNIGEMFFCNRKLHTIQGTLNLYWALTNLKSAFYETQALTGVTLKNIRGSLQIGSGTSYGHLWELSYLINAVKELWDYSSSTSTYTLTIGTANMEKIANTYVKLITPTAEQIAADPYINDKLPCEECESTDEGAMTLEAYATLKNWTLA